MGDFAFRITPNIILGSYTLSRLPQQVMEWGTRFMIIADPVLNEFGTIQKITQSFTDRKIEHFVFSEISEGNTSQLAKRALALAKEGHVHGHHVGSHLIRLVNMTLNRQRFNGVNGGISNNILKMPLNCIN